MDKEWIEITKQTKLKEVLKPGKFYWLRIDEDGHKYTRVDICPPTGVTDIYLYQYITHIMEAYAPAPPKSKEEVVIDKLKDLLSLALQFEPSHESYILYKLKELNIEL